MMTLEEAIAIQETARTQCREAREAHRLAMIAEHRALTRFWMAQRSLEAADLQRQEVLNLNKKR